MRGTCWAVKAIISRFKPGTAMESSLDPIAALISFNSKA